MCLGLVGLLIATVTLGGCGPEFDPFNLVKGFRVLGLRADKPELRPGETAVLDALVVSESHGDVTFAWSWCPFSLGAAGGYECAVTEEEMAGLVEGAPAGSGIALPPYDLGDGPTAEFTYAIPPEMLMLLCQSTPVPICTQSYPIQIMLRATGPEGTVTAVREVGLMIRPGPEPNHNPVVGDLSVEGPGLDGVVSLDGAAALARDEDYELSVTVPEAAIEVYTPASTEFAPDPPPQQERLTFTWFVEGGRTDSQRTGFIPTEGALDEALRNGWLTPTQADESREQLNVTVVVRDDRGGLDWITEPISLR